MRRRAKTLLPDLKQTVGPRSRGIPSGTTAESSETAERRDGGCVRNSVLSFVGKSAKSSMNERDTMVRYVGNHAAYFLFVFVYGLLAVPPTEQEFESAPLLFIWRRALQNEREVRR